MQKEIPGVVTRMTIELQELSSRLNRATEFSRTGTFSSLPLEEQELFNEQIDYMSGYERVLSKRLGMIKTRLDL